MQVHFFKQSGKWMETLEIPLTHNDGLIHDDVQQSILEFFTALGRPDAYGSAFVVVVDTEPHRHAHPITLGIGDDWRRR